MSENENENKIDKEKGDKFDFNFKIIVIGNSGVGKSCLTLKATKDIFQENFVSTMGFQFYSFHVKINQKIFKLQIWDTCGQEIYRSLITNFYRTAALAIIVYSVTDKKSFEETEIWLKQVKMNADPNCKIFLIANKVDSPERIITTEQGNKCRTDFNFDLYMETSAKSGFNSKELFINAANILKRENEKINFYGNNPNSEQKMLNSIKLRIKKKNDKNKQNDDDEQYDDEGCCA